VNVEVPDPTVVQSVRGSEPICSEVYEVEAVAGTGNVTGIGTLQDPALALTLALTILPLVTVYDMLGRH